VLVIALRQLNFIADIAAVSVLLLCEMLLMLAVDLVLL